VVISLDILNKEGRRSPVSVKPGPSVWRIRSLISGLPGGMIEEIKAIIVLPLIIRGYDYGGPHLGSALISEWEGNQDYIASAQDF